MGRQELEDQCAARGLKRDAFYIHLTYPLYWRGGGLAHSSEDAVGSLAMSWRSSSIRRNELLRLHSEKQTKIQASRRWAVRYAGYSLRAQLWALFRWPLANHQPHIFEMVHAGFGVPEPEALRMSAHQDRGSLARLRQGRCRRREFAQLLMVGSHAQNLDSAHRRSKESLAACRAVVAKQRYSPAAARPCNNSSMFRPSSSSMPFRLARKRSYFCRSAGLQVLASR